MTNSEIRQHMISAREEYIDLIKSELLGPGSEFSLPDKEHELISSSPTNRYSIGILYPQGNAVNHDNDETLKFGETINSSESTYSVSNDAAEINQDQPNKQITYTFDEAVDGEDVDENLDEEIGMSTQYMPSSMGITFIVKGNTNVVKGCLTFATYRRAKVHDCIIPYMPDNPDTYTVPNELARIMVYDKNIHALRLVSDITAKEARNIFEHDTISENEFSTLKKIVYRFVDYCSIGYVRVPHEIPEFVLDFSNGDYVDNDINHNLDGTDAKLVALRRKMENNLWSITIMLVNDRKESPIKANDCIFQARIKVSSENNDFLFVENNSNADVTEMDSEERSLDLLYRHKKIYGSGLGTSIDWKINSSGAGAIWNDFFPTIEIPSMSFSLPQNDLIKDKELSMKYLSDLDASDRATKLASMKNLVDLYKNWVNSLEKTAKTLDPRYKSAAVNNISECKRAYSRMYAGIETLSQNDNAYNAFLLANRAMFMQRIHIAMQESMSKTCADRYPGDEEIAEKLLNMDYRQENDVNCKWRPFQIAFLLMDINSIIYDNSPDRNVVDLIWFPTGGGKTEAYLGLTAFTIFYRKLAFPQTSNGTAVIMRYTLRLLAAQQFTRASTLICACEYIRQDCNKNHKYPVYPLGKEPITIGLWIGGSHIPNKSVGAGENSNTAEYHLKELQNVNSANYVRNVKERHNKFQVLKCPWCGTKMVKDNKNGHLVGDWGYAMRQKHFYMFCPHEECDFTNRLPIQIIDDELYKTPPTLLFGTVDKFAMLPWDGRIGALFGVGTENRTPELIIQDELHLISGALGTIVGLYETAVDAICGLKGVFPKIIASTATIRKAKEQCSVLYNREVVQFPAPGLNADDSFFATESVIDYNKCIYGRKYIGIMPSGKTKAMTEIRAMAALIQKAYPMELPEEVKDKLWTLTVYFNSLKDLGKASTLVEDDVKDFIIRTANRMFTKRRLIGSADELTSRVSTTELNETLDKLEKIEYSKENINNKLYASNILLATNMISVGIDVARLNTMLIIGQPKLTSEYIQASSRVGRSFPGVVFVQYDATKSRDRSHYERFRSYHESCYRFVEPTGATPFSQPARERALHAVLISIIRQMTGLCQDKDAIKFDEEHFAKTLKTINRFVTERVIKINERSNGKAKYNVDEIKIEIKELFDFWQEIVDECKIAKPSIPLYFGRQFMINQPRRDQRRLLKQYGSKGKDSSLETLTSMRNVDSPVVGSLIIWEDNNV